MGSGGCSTTSPLPTITCSPSRRRCARVASSSKCGPRPTMWAIIRCTQMRTLPRRMPPFGSASGSSRLILVGSRCKTAVAGRATATPRSQRRSPSSQPPHMRRAGHSGPMWRYSKAGPRAAFTRQNAGGTQPRSTVWSSSSRARTRRAPAPHCVGMVLVPLTIHQQEYIRLVRRLRCVSRPAEYVLARPSRWKRDEGKLKPCAPQPYHDTDSDRDPV